MTNNSSNSNGHGGTNAAASSWLGFSLSPNMAASAIDDDDDHHHVHQQQQNHGGLFYPSVTAAAAAYGLVAGDSATTSPYYTPPQLASMPLKSDGSLCIMEALRRTDQDHHGNHLINFVLAFFFDLFVDHVYFID